MVTSSQKPHLTPKAYLQFEEKSPVKHEYIDGQVYAMAGASDAHVTIALNLAAMLRSQVRGSGCRVYISDMKVRLEKKNRFFYPDVVVTCDSRDQETPNFKRFPCLIVEVLSESTETFDRGDKFFDYQTLDSLQEYVLINTRRQRVECYRRKENGLWELQPYTEFHPTFELRSIGFEGAIADLYEDVTYDPTVEPPDDR